MLLPILIQDAYPSDIQNVVLGAKRVNSWESRAPLEVPRQQSAFGLDKPTFSLTKRLHFRTISLTDKRRKSRGWYCLPSNLEPRSNTRSLDRFISAYLIHLISFYFAINHIKYIYNIQYIYNTVADLGEGPRGPRGPSPSLFLDQTEVRMAETFLLETASPLSQGLDDRPLPPHLKVWIRHCNILIDGIHNVTNFQGSIGKEAYVEA